MVQLRRCERGACRSGNVSISIQGMAIRFGHSENISESDALYVRIIIIIWNEAIRTLTYSVTYRLATKQ